MTTTRFNAHTKSDPHALLCASIAVMEASILRVTRRLESCGFQPLPGTEPTEGRAHREGAGDQTDG